MAQVRYAAHLLREDEVLGLDVPVQDARPVHGRHRRRHLQQTPHDARPCMDVCHAIIWCTASLIS